MFAIYRSAGPHPLIPFLVWHPCPNALSPLFSLVLGLCFQAEVVKADKKQVPTESPKPVRGSTGWVIAP